MTFGIKGGRPSPLDLYLAVVRMHDDLRDPAKRSEIIGEFEAEHAKLAAARTQHDRYVVESQGRLNEDVAVAKRDADEARAEAGERIKRARDEADRIVAEARALAEQKLAAVSVEDEKLRLAAKSVALELTEARRLQAQAEADRLAAESARANSETALANVQKIQAENDRRAEAAGRLAAELR